MTTSERTFSYGVTTVRELELSTTADERTGKGRVTGVRLGRVGLQTRPTKRFWQSFFHRFGIADNVFKYFDHAEVFTRIAERAKDDSVRFCVEHRGGGQDYLLAVSNPTRTVPAEDEVNTLVTRYGAGEVHYHEGVVTSLHVPRSGEGTFSIGGDEFKNRFVLDTPIDGFGLPKIHLSLLRTVCANGAVGYARAFRSELSLGKDPLHSLTRALESFDNGDGYSALRQRFESSQHSWASIHECDTLYRQFSRLANSRDIAHPQLLRRFQEMTGNLSEMYGLANLDALSVKRRRLLPARCRVYDLLNFATEMATHHSTVFGGRALQAYVGTLISDEYDMEGTADKGADFSDLFLPGEGAIKESVN